MTQQTILRITKAKERTGLSRTTLYSLIKEGKFPAPIPLGARAVGWLESEVDAWIESRVKARSQNA
jgi:prophage regulatory protein